MKRFLTLLTLTLALMLSGSAQNTDTISKNLKRPPVLDLLGTNKGKAIPVSSSRPIRNNASNQVQPKKSRKTVKKSAPREKTILSRALNEYVPED